MSSCSQLYKRQAKIIPQTKEDVGSPSQKPGKNLPQKKAAEAVHLFYENYKVSQSMPGITARNL